MYSRASQFIQGSGIWSAGCGPRPKVAAVVSFRMQNDNKGRKRIFRVVKGFTTKGQAETYLHKSQALCDKSQVLCKVLIYRNKILKVVGDETVVQLWCETRGGLNRNIDPFLGDGKHCMGEIR